LLASIVPQVFPNGEELQSLDELQDGYELGIQTFSLAPLLSVPY
jgi:hypothetical protein